MRKNIICSILFAAVATTFVSCVKEEMNNQVDDNKVAREFVLAIENQTKTTFGEGAQPQLKWVAGDDFGFLTTGAEGNLDVNVQATVPAEGTSVSVPVNEAAATVYAYYPFVDSKATPTVSTPSEVALYVSPSQRQETAGEFLGSMLPMWAKATINAEGATTLKFNPVASILALNVYGKADEKLSYVVFTPSAGTPSGLLTHDLTSETVTGAFSKGNKFVAVSLDELYQLPAAKPSDKSGYVYMAVVPGKYNGGTFTVVTDKAKYEFTTSAEIDLSNVYAPVTVPVDLSGKEPVSTYLYYENFGKALGHLQAIDGLLPAGYECSGTVETAHAAVNIKNSSSLTTKAFDFLGSEPKDLKVTFFANGWRGKNNYIKVIAKTGDTETVVEDNIQLTGFPTTDRYRFAMDKSTSHTVVVKGATKDTRLAFTNGTEDTSDRPWFAVDDIAVEEYAGPTAEVAYKLDLTLKTGQGDFNMTRTEFNPYNGVSWTLTKCAPNNKNYTGAVLGINSKNFATCMLVDAATKLNNRDNTQAIDYSRVGAPCGYQGDTQGVSAAVSEQTMKNVQKVVVYNDVYGGAANPEKISLVYSLDDKTYTLIGTQDYAAHAGGNNTWIFEPVPEAYYAIVIYKSVAGDMLTDCLKADFYAVPAAE